MKAGTVDVKRNATALYYSNKALNALSTGAKVA
jgi:hypothetical protein